jgi:Uma2 family endonuclease
LKTNDLGQVLAPDATLRILPGTVKMPDVSFVSWSRFPEQGLTRRPIPSLVPDLAVEVLSETNTPDEMARKLTQYFRAGVRLVWYIDPDAHAASVYTSPTDVRHVAEDGTLDGGEVLCGLSLSLRELFARANRRGPVR